MIDPHVHCRDWNQSHKETIEHALYVAEKAGLSAVFDMPNTSPSVTSRALIEKRIDDADKINSPVFYGLYAGLTLDKNQIIEAVNAWKELFPAVIGLKMYAGHSVGNLGIINEDEQNLVYKTLAEHGFAGVLAVHCEKESFIHKSAWNPAIPKSHSYARPGKAEIESVLNQVHFAEKNNFHGSLHICHVSVPESVEIVEHARQNKKIKITCGVTPHHIMLNYEMIPDSEQGLLYKVNPPLRDKKTAERMMEFLKRGKIDWIETDHAPHTLKEKLENHMSGFPGMPFYPVFVDYLSKNGFDRQQIIKITHDNICTAFCVNFEKRNPENYDLHKEYEVDVYKEIRKWKKEQ